jgi:hypothetical protein
MSIRLRSSVPLLLTIILLPACSTPPLRIQSDDVPAGSLRVAQLVAIAKREDIVQSKDEYKAIIAAGVADSDLQNGSVVVARIYCCGGVSETLSSEYVNRMLLYVPRGIKTAVGDFVEVKVGRPPEQGDGGRLNTVTRVVAQIGDKPESCWWEPRNPNLWLRYPYCEWMPQEGWGKQDSSNPAWFKPGS